MSSEDDPIDWLNLGTAIAALVVTFVLLYLVSGAPGLPEAWIPPPPGQ